MSRELMPSKAIRGTAIVLFLGFFVFNATADAPVKISSDVAVADDLALEIRSLITAQSNFVASEAEFANHRDQSRRLGIQIAILARALAEHESNQEMKPIAPILRELGQKLSQSRSFEETRSVVSTLQSTLEKKQHEATNPRLVKWNQLGSTGAMMSLLKERSELVRKGLRRPKDPAAESRNAMVMAIAALVVHEDGRNFKTSMDRADWQQASQDVQQHMSLCAKAIRNSETPTAATEFRLAMESCDRCHEKFKP